MHNNGKMYVVQNIKEDPEINNVEGNLLSLQERVKVVQILQ